LTPFAPHAVIEIGGAQYDSWRDAQLFMEARAELATGEASEATWKVFDPNFVFMDKFAESDGVKMLPARLWLGFGQSLGEPVFKGLMARVERGSEATTLRFYDEGLKMRLKTRAEYHSKATDVEIIRKLAQRNELKFEGPAQPFGVRYNSMMHDERTDWEHAKELAENAGLVLYVRGDTLFAKEPAKVGTPKLAMRFREDFTILHNFNLAYKLPEAIKGKKHHEVRARGRGGHRVAGRSKVNTRGQETIEFKRDVKGATRAVAERRAQARKDLEREHAFTLSVESVPQLKNVRADVRDTIQLLKLGKLFSGLYLCDRVTHALDASSFRTTFNLYRDAKDS
jgi:phage protein D